MFPHLPLILVSLLLLILLPQFRLFPLTSAQKHLKLVYSTLNLSSPEYPPTGSSKTLTHPGNPTAPESPVLSLLKSLLQQLLGWIFSSLPADSSTAAILYTLMQLLFFFLSSSA